MSIFDIFKSASPSGAMSEDDREKLFWYLKRKTSYSAWKREADAFDRFAAIFEKQVREEPVAQPGLSVFPTNWESSYPDILRIQVLYEQGLERLRRADRNVWLQNSLGALNQANMLANVWYTNIVNQGPRGDNFFDGKYLDAMTDAMQEFFEVTQDTGYLQARIAETPAPELWSTLWRYTFAALPLPDPLPPVPQPGTDILIRSADEVPASGIYEPQIKDGCMNYLLAQTPAPPMWESDGRDATGRIIKVTWRLIWEDTRYRDALLPAEERAYFPKSVARPVVSTSVDDATVSAVSGQFCPKSGDWAVMDDLNARMRLMQSERMPEHEGREVNWVWLNR